MSRFASQLKGTSSTEKSRSSGPWIAFKTTAQSSTLRHIGPILSRLHVSVINPDRLTRPAVGRKPVTPQIPDGSTIDPPVSVPIENPTSPAAVAEAGPADDPCDPIDRSQGFFVCPPNHTSSSASSPVANLATSTAPASRNRKTTVVSRSITRSLNGAAPHVVGYSRRAPTSVMPYGLPCTGP